MLKNLKEIYFVLNSNQKKRFFLLQFFIILNAFLELVSIFAILSYINIISSNNSVLERGYFSNFFLFLQNYFNESLITSFGLITSLIIFFNTLVAITTTYFLSRFSYKTGGEISVSLLNHYMKKDWLYHVNVSNSKLTSNIYNQVGILTASILEPTLQIIAKLFLIIPLILGAILYDAKISSAGILIFFVSYVFIFKYFKPLMHSKGQTITNLAKDKYALINESFGGIKEIKLSNNYEYYINLLKNIFKKDVNAGSVLTLIGHLPRHLIEFISLSIIIIFTIILHQIFSYSFNNLVSLMAFFIVILFKLLPSFQQIYFNLARIRSGVPAFLEIRNDLFEIKNNNIKNKKINYVNNNKFNKFKKINLNNIEFSYNKDLIPSIKVNLELKSSSIIGITGLSGSGKTTLVNILLGLIRPQKGSLIINNEEINNENLYLWQKNIGYVPQSIYISEKSIAENIVFGTPTNKIDYSKLNFAINASNLTSVIKNLKNGYNSKIGEYGAKFSGGQIQRIGIARALYNNPKLLIFDEATNALDSLTENEIIKSIRKLTNERMIIIIAHRLKTIESCDKIIFLKNGQLSGFDNFENLIKSNEDFKKLTEINSSQKKIQN